MYLFPYMCYNKRKYLYTYIKLYSQYTISHSLQFNIICNIFALDMAILPFCRAPCIEVINFKSTQPFEDFCFPIFADVKIRRMVNVNFYNIRLVSCKIKLNFNICIFTLNTFQLKNNGINFTNQLTDQ